MDPQKILEAVEPDCSATAAFILHNEGIVRSHAETWTDALGHACPCKHVAAAWRDEERAVRSKSFGHIVNACWVGPDDESVSSNMLVALSCGSVARFNYSSLTRHSLVVEGVVTCGEEDRKRKAADAPKSASEPSSSATNVLNYVCCRWEGASRVRFFCVCHKTIRCIGITFDDDKVYADHIVTELPPAPQPLPQSPSAKGADDAMQMQFNHCMNLVAAFVTMPRPDAKTPVSFISVMSLSFGQNSTASVVVPWRGIDQCVDMCWVGDSMLALALNKHEVAIYSVDAHSSVESGVTLLAKRKVASRLITRITATALPTPPTLHSSTLLYGLFVLSGGTTLELLTAGTSMLRDAGQKPSKRRREDDEAKDLLLTTVATFSSPDSSEFDDVVSTVGNFTSQPYRSALEGAHAVVVTRAGAVRYLRVLPSAMQVCQTLPPIRSGNHKDHRLIVLSRRNPQCVVVLEAETITVFHR